MDTSLVDHSGTEYNYTGEPPQAAHACLWQCRCINVGFSVILNVEFIYPHLIDVKITVILNVFVRTTFVPKYLQFALQVFYSFMYMYKGQFRFGATC